MKADSYFELRDFLAYHALKLAEKKVRQEETFRQACERKKQELDTAFLNRIAGYTPLDMYRNNLNASMFRWRGGKPKDDGDDEC